jgi:subtilisin family serine protease
VAAIDVNQVRASFSQYNKQVELCRAGRRRASTVLMTGSTATVSVNGLAPEADAWRVALATASGALVNCGTGEASCAGAAGKVCLIQRGTNTFAEKVLNCQTGGGVAAVIYNNVDGALLGTLGGVATSIPSVGISKADGETLVAQQLGQTATVSVAASNYAKFDGTSMATPHVSAVAALVWSYYPTCTNAQVRNVLDATAKDLGAAGRDVYYGYGLVQAKAAYDRLTAGDCGGPSASGKGKP